MLDKLTRHVKRNWGVYSWLFGTASFLFLVAWLASGGREGLVWTVFLLLILGFWFGVLSRFVRFFQWLGVSRLHNLAKDLGSSDPEKRGKALKELLKMGKKAVPIFANVLSASPAQLKLVDWDGIKARRLAAKGLGELKAEEGFNALVRVLDDPDEILRQEAIYALGKIGDRRAIHFLLPLLSEPLPLSETVRYALRDLGASEVVDAWLKALKHRDKNALGKLRAYREEIVEALFKGLERNVFEEQVALNAVWAISELGSAEIIPKLRSLALGHPNDKVCEALLQAIDKLSLISRLPRPATSPTLDTSTLPRPAAVSDIDTSKLPAIPSD